ncbi:MAG: STAS domain-containing protein [Gemmataceae bacterium]
MPSRTISPALADVEASLRLLSIAFRHEEATGREPSTLVLELKGVKALTASGLGQLVSLHHRLAATGRKLVLQNVGDGAYQAVAATGLHRLLDVRSPN